MVVHELRYVNPKPRKPAEMGICQVAPCLHYPALKLPLQGGSVGLTVNIPKPSKIPLRGKTRPPEPPFLKFEALALGLTLFYCFTTFSLLQC